VLECRLRWSDSPRRIAGDAGGESFWWVLTEYPFPVEFNSARYTRLYLYSQANEARVQADVITLLRSYGVDACAIDAGGRRARGRMMAAAKSAGVALAGIQNVKTGSAIPAGFADVEATLAPDGRALYIEIKAPAWINSDGSLIRRAGKPSAEQLEFLMSKHRRGALVLIAWSATDVNEWFQTELAENQRALRRATCR